MSIIKLKNVSKFYYSKGVVASGFTKVNLEFSIGEFVAITGESGSGKSTLLNVISGIDTYEEGELYINGQETSHYIEKDFEDYRRKYIGNIFQNFNLVNSYTVYQNIELVLLLNGKKKKEIKNDVINLIKKVGLYKFRNTKASKLSGGQKQRVAIARALAKDTPIIIADEPTGNLDSKNSVEIIKLLSEISKDKLVIIVTHNYDQVEKYVTRKIKMHDGKILEDKKIKEIKPSQNSNLIEYRDITLLNRFRLALRNTFNIVPKFILLLLVYLFMTTALISEYASFKEQEYISNSSGSNEIFTDISDNRIIINKNDKTAFTDKDYKNISNIKGVSYIVKNDILLDNQINITDKNRYLWISGNIKNIDTLDSKLDEGRMPKGDNEIIVLGNRNDYYITGDEIKKLFNIDFYLEDGYSDDLDMGIKLKIVGIKYLENPYDYDYSFYVSEKLSNTISLKLLQRYNNIQVLFENKIRQSSIYENDFNIKVNNNVEKGKIYIPDSLSSECPKNNCINQSLDINVSNIYYNVSKSFVVSKTYTKNNLKQLLNIDNYDNIDGNIFISEADYNELLERGSYQSSVFVNDVNKTSSIIKKLNDQGYKTLALKDTLVNSNMVILFQIIKTIVTIIVVIVLIFISYFVIKIILKSRNKYYTTIRILGANKNIAKQLLIYELFIVSNISYFLFLLFLYLNKVNILNVKFTKTIFTYLRFNDYVILYIILLIMSLILSIKYSRKLFKKSAISTLNMEV